MLSFFFSQFNGYQAGSFDRPNSSFGGPLTKVRVRWSEDV
jgi:hypothetical protein